MTAIRYHDRVDAIIRFLANQNVVFVIHTSLSLRGMCLFKQPLKSLYFYYKFTKLKVDRFSNDKVLHGHNN